MKIFLDANILVAVLNKEYPLFSDAARIISLADNQKFQVYTSPICLAIAFYFAEKKSGRTLAKKKITLLASHVIIAETNSSVVLHTIENKKIEDFEDGLEYYSALNAGCTTIIAEDTSDFYFSEIEVMKSRHFIEKYFLSTINE